MPRKRDGLGGRISVLGESGVASQLGWRRGDAGDSLLAARLFDSLCASGYHAFAVSAAHGSRRIQSFSAAFCEVVLTPGCAGGWDDCDAAAWQASMKDVRELLRSLLGLLPREPLGPGGGLRARRQALCLLLSMLNATQRRSLRESACFDVRGGASGCLYRIRAAGQADIEQLDEHGNMQYRLQIGAACRLSQYACLSAHALHLQDPESEHAYLSGAAVLAGRA